MSYVDLHCHLLPGLDDGAATMAATLAHAARLEAAGVRDVACTPHVKRIEFPRIDLIRLERLRDEAQRLIDGRGIDVRLHGGGELGHDDALLLAPDELEMIAQGPAHARWLLLECPFEGMEDDFVEAAERLWELGYDLLLAHPERAAPVPGADDRLLGLVDRGALLQVNATSLLGRHGMRAKAGAERLLGDGLVWCLASDGHPGTRDDTLDRGYEALVRGGTHERVAALLTRDNPRTLLVDGASRLALAA
ncbi:MAG TPA: CpsB/CapC family capsule biosynthesis tyrosine phosphatase [Candidatus Limnocylindrales bacterium]